MLVYHCVKGYLAEDVYHRNVVQLLGDWTEALQACC